MSKDGTFVWKSNDINIPIKMIGISNDIKNQGAYIAYNEISNQINQTIKDKCGTYKTGDGRLYYIFGYGNLDLENVLETFTINKNPKSNELLTEIFEKPQIPKSISIEELIEIIKNKHIMLYTGAGISIAAQIPDLEGMREYLGINNEQDNLFTINLFNNMNVIKDKINSLSKSFFKGTTEAHGSLKRIQDILNFDLVTENIDSLHENTGANIINRTEMVEKITSERIKYIEYLITIGLARDDSGLISKYKSINKEGIIIAINVKAPEYLRSTDYYIKEDAQILIPKIEIAIKQP